MKKNSLWIPEHQKQQQMQIQQQRKNSENFPQEDRVFELQGKLAYHDPYKYKQYFGIVQYQIEYSKNGTQTIFYNGQILRKQQIRKVEYQNQNIENLEQIQYLNWEGNYGNNNQKIGKWFAFWKGEKSLAGGIYDEFECKQGAWVELDQNFCDYCQVFHLGNYNNGRKIGVWQTLYNGQIIGGGLYDDNEQKNGSWTDLHINFNDWNKITYLGVYKNDKKQGQWNTIFQREIIGGGYYDENGLKNGEWTDIDDQICDIYNQMIYVGEYINGIKKGNWLTIQNGNILGGGNFDVYGMKNGKWIDVIKNVNQGSYVAEMGSYLNGIRIAQWNYVYRGQTIGGGNYNEEGHKNGEWIELQDNFKRYINVQSKGIYSNGIKSGKWITFYEGDGEGQYNEYGYKIGNWIKTTVKKKQFKYFEYLNSSIEQKYLINELIGLQIYTNFCQYLNLLLIFLQIYQYMYLEKLDVMGKFHQKLVVQKFN